MGLFLTIIKIFYGNMYLIKYELDHFEEKFTKTLQIFVKKSDLKSDLALFFRIRILHLPGQKFPDPQHCKEQLK